MPSLRRSPPLTGWPFGMTGAAQCVNTTLTSFEPELDHAASLRGCVQAGAGSGLLGAIGAHVKCMIRHAGFDHVERANRFGLRAREGWTGHHVVHEAYVSAPEA